MPPLRKPRVLVVAPRVAHRAFTEVVAEHKRVLDRVSQHGAVAKVKRLYNAAQAHLVRRLDGLVRDQRGERFSAHQARMFLVQIRQGQLQMGGRLAAAMNGQARETQRLALDVLIHDVHKLDRTFRGAEMTLPIEEAARFLGVLDRRRTSLLVQHATSMARYGATVVDAMENQLAMSLAVGETPSQAIGRIENTADVEWWRGERIVRTETAWTFNATHYDGIQAAATEVPELEMRWSEHVTDAGDPMDTRVGADSIALHGQVAGGGGVFTMPSDDSDVSPKLVGRQWAHPPNRPNDRAVLAPFREDWGLPGYRWVGARLPINGGIG